MYSDKSKDRNVLVQNITTHLYFDYTDQLLFTQYCTTQVPITTTMILVHEFLLCHMLTITLIFTKLKIFLKTPPLNLGWGSPPS